MRYSSKTLSFYNMEPRQVRKLLFHLLFFFGRIAAFAVLYGNAYYLNAQNIFIRVDIEDITYLLLLNGFVLYLLIKSIVFGNIYKYYLSIIVLINNTVITMCLPLLEIDKVFNIFWQMYTVISSLYLLEAIISMIWLYFERNENNLELFKRIGVNPDINNAFAARMRLGTLCEINVFMSTLLQGKFWVPPTPSFKILAGVKFIDAGVTYIQQLFISVNFNEEDVVQRRVAIGLSVVNIFFPIGLFIWEQILSKENHDIHSDFFKFIYLDMLLIAVFMTLFLIHDYYLFGSGLKEYMKFKTKRLHLCTHHK